jgi:hypothetical protein
MKERRKSSRGRKQKQSGRLDDNEDSDEETRKTKERYIPFQSDDEDSTVDNPKDSEVFKKHIYIVSFIKRLFNTKLLILCRET